MNTHDRSKKVLTLFGALIITVLLAYQLKLRNGGSEAPATTANPPQTETPLADGPRPHPSPQNQQAPKKTAAAAAFESAKPVLTPPAGTKGPPGYASKPVDSVVEFEIKDGYAVAFGDLVLGKPPADFDQLRGLAEVARPHLWIRGEVPYMILPEVSHPDRVQAAIQMFHQSTGLKFVPHSDQPDAIAFTQSDEHCASYLGRVGGLQPIFLSDKCTPADIAHEMMHALGFVHEQSRIDRDQHVAIQWENVQKKYQSQYAMVPESLMEIYGDSSFDPESLLMYGRTAFAVDPRKPTMRLKNGRELHDAPKGLSERDIERVNRLYRE